MVVTRLADAGGQMLFEPWREASGIDSTGYVPRVSVVMPLFNKARHVGAAVQSVLAQTETDFELIIVDDGSTDGSAAVVRQLGDPRIRLVTQKNMGAAHARNRGIAEARADLVAFLDADDRWLPEFLPTILRLRARYPDAGAYATAYCLCRQDGTLREADLAALPPAPWEGLIPGYFRAATLGEGLLTASSAAVPKEVLV
ncbi:MAG: glycosyltransferase family A protein, partial [Methanomicrobiales archaeon]|nr:glycosyltransferase family A protein [Methanomicrobiales archaeon]